MKKKVSGSLMDGNGPRIFIPIAACAGTERLEKISRKRARIPGLAL